LHAPSFDSCTTFDWRLTTLLFFFALQNTALYSTFAVVGFFAGTIVNRLGVRAALSFGGIGYCLYSISLLVSVHKYVPGFNIFAGAFLGVCAGLLWTAQGTIMMSYPLEQSKGRYFAWFWAIFNVGACIGSLVSDSIRCAITCDCRAVNSIIA
jgi:MFS family permease